MSGERRVGPAERCETNKRSPGLTGGAFMLILLATAGLLLAACGGSPGPGIASLGSSTTTSSASTASESTYQLALKHFECMRSHGVPNFPDPNAQGGVQMNSSKSGIDIFSSSYKSAVKACEKFESTAGQSVSPLEHTY